MQSEDILTEDKPFMCHLPIVKTQFSSDVMTNVYRLLSIKSITTSSNHAQRYCLCEKYNSAHSKMLKRENY